MSRSKVGAFGVVALLFAAFAAITPAFAAESPDQVWRDVDERVIPRGPRERQIVPERYRAFALNRGRLTALLATAPLEQTQRAHQSKLQLTLPMPDGSYAAFRVVESPIMEPALQAKYPTLRTYLGQGIDDPTATVRFDLTHKGFRAQVIAASGTVYVDPFQPGDVDHYIAYRKHDHHRGERMICEVTGEPILEDHAKALFGAKVSSGASLRTYRLAMAATGEYTQFHGGTVVDGLAAIVTTMNRVNGIYEREVAVRMVLVANNDQIVFTNPATDPYANTSNDLNANQTTIDSRIGSANYDIGHLVGTGGGGIAQLRSPCTSSKARGLTGSGAPIGDAFDIDYVAHEMGHQYGGNHTFNGSGGSCSGTNRNASTAYEPGSGITIQAYAGICVADDLQPNSEDYFHRVSLNEIIAFTTNASTGASCGTATSTGNQPPTFAALTARTIPVRTPFTLTASATDPDGDALTYVWEQFDLGAANTAGTLDPTTPAGPIFRGFNPSADPSRTFPSLRYILNNGNVVPATAPLPGTTSPNWMTGEVLPNVLRTLNFTVTARDNRAGGGGTNEASVQVTVSPVAGPFEVTAPNTAVTLPAGAATNITWNVANTTLPPVSTANVRITLSTDGGYTFPIVLAASTANDGSESLVLPAGIATTQARVKIEAVDNIYFDVSNANFAITSGNSAPSIAVTGGVTTRQGSPTASAVVATVSDMQDAAGSLAVSVTGAPTELAVSVQNVGGSVTLSATADCKLVAPTSGNKVYPVLLRVADSAGAVTTAEVNVSVGRNLTPTLGNYANLFTTQNIVRTHAPAALAADGNGNLTGASVSPTTLPGGGTIAIAPDGTLTVTTTPSTTNGSTTVVAEVADSCGAVERRNAVIQVAAPQISLAVDAVEVVTGNGLLEPNECNDVLVRIRNNGNVPATGVSGAISTATANVSITQGSSGYPDIPPGESRANTTAYVVSSTNALACFTNVSLNVNVAYSGGAGSPFNGTASVPVGRAVAQNYAFTVGTGTLPPTNQMTLLSGSQQDDGNTNLVVPTGFSFQVYDTVVAGGTTLRASSNGNLQFRNNQGATDAGNTTLPTTGAGNGQAVFPPTAPTLFLQWDDWRLDAADAVNVAPDAGIYTRLEGTAPNRSWIVEWRGRVRGDGLVGVNNNRAAIVFHEGSNSFDYIYEKPGVGAAAGAAGSTIGVQAAATGTRFTQFAFNDANLAANTKLTATIAPAICAPGSGPCAGPPGVTITQSGGNTAVTEGGATDTYTVVLTAPPTGDVTIAVTPDAQLATSGNLVFTTGDWNQPKTVTVTAVDDFVAEGTHSGTITHSASGGGYDGVSIAGVTATITDNDTAAVVVTQSGGTTAVTEGGATDSYTLVLTSQPTGPVTISVTPDAQLTTSGNVTFTAADWNQAQTVTVTAVDDAIAEGLHTGAITHSASGGGYNGVSIAGVTASITDNDTAGVVVTQSAGSTDVTEGGATDTYTLVLTSQPTGTVTIAVSPDAQLTTSGNVTFTAADWNQAKTVTVTAVDDAIAEGAHTGSIAHSASGGGYNGVSVAGITANITDNDTAGVVVTQSDGSTDVVEGGATDSYTLVLTSQPTGPVTITVTPDAQLTTSGNVSFDATDWNQAKTVTVTAVDDALVEGPHTGSIAHSASGGGYDAVSVAGITANVADNDTAGVVVTQSGGSTDVAEGGATDTYTIVLTAQPTGDVTIAVSPDAQLTTSGNLVFTTSDWNVAKTVTVTAVDDAIAEGTHAGTITHSASGGGYDGVSIASVTATITDNDTAGVVVTQSGGSTDVTEGGATDSYTLVLTSQPAGTVTIAVTPDAQLTTSGNVTFDAGDWSTPKTVTVAAVDDAVDEGTHTGAITHAASGGGYDGVAVAGVTATITDNDTAGESLVDVAVSSQLTNAPALAGKRLVYEVAVENLTAAVPASAQFTFALPGFLENVSWVCVADLGATCPANGTGAPNHAITLAGGTGVSYAISADVPANTAEGTSIDTLATATVTAPTDSAPGNNAAATSHVVGTDALFRDGFEDPVAAARAALGLD